MNKPPVLLLQQLYRHKFPHKHLASDKKTRKKREVTPDTNAYSDFKSDGKRKPHAADSIRSYDDYHAIEQYYLDRGQIRDWATDRGTAEPISARDRRDGEGASRDEYIPDGTEPWGDRADESRGSAEMDADDEQSEASGRGGSAEQFDLSVNLPPLSDPDSLMQILRHGDYLRVRKESIVSFLSSDASEAEKIEYVKNAYPPLQFSEFYKDGTEQHLGYRADGEGLLLYEGNYPSRTAQTRMDWAFVT